MMKTCMSCSSIEYFQVIKLRIVKALDIWHTWERREIYTGLWWENMTERNKLGHLAVDARECENRCQRNGMQGVYWIHVARVLVHMTKKRLVLD